MRSIPLVRTRDVAFAFLKLACEQRERAAHVRCVRRPHSHALKLANSNIFANNRTRQNICVRTRLVAMASSTLSV
jgi:hypothetical protein